MGRRDEAIERDRWLGLVGALPGTYVHRCEPMVNAHHVRALPNGFPDVLFYAEGKVVPVEWKRGGKRPGTLSEDQLRVHAAMAEGGVTVLMAYTAGDCCRDLAARFGGATAERLFRCAELLDNKKVAADCK